jgi:two-component sensor histidine kinase
MQIIFSLINFQSRYIKDKDALHIFKETQDRVRSMALIHEKFYQTKDLSRINFVGYVKNLIAALIHSYGVRNGDVAIDLKIKSVWVGINTGIPCGLIINELVSNSLKHAFSDGRKGKIVIDFHPHKDNKYILNFSDDGIGFPEDIDFRNTESFGLQLINTLVNQLEGSIELDCRKGTAFRIVFEKLKHELPNRNDAA